MIVALSSFLVAQGWTATAPWAEMSAGAATGNTLAAITDPNGSITTFAFTASTLLMNMATAIDPTKKITQQPGANWRNLSITPITGPYVGYHFFTDGAAVNVAIELVPNIFTHLNFGTVTKNGAWSGGQYITGLRQGNIAYGLMSAIQNSYPFKAANQDGSNPSYAGSLAPDQGFMRQGITVTGWADFAASSVQYNVGQYMPSNPVVVNHAVCANMGMRLLNSSPNGFNGRAALLPVVLTMSSNIEGGGGMYQIGCVPNVAMLNIRDLEPKAVINNEWMVFPLSQKNGNGSTYMNSANYGIAYRK